MARSNNCCVNIGLLLVDLPCQDYNRLPIQNLKEPKKKYQKKERKRCDYYFLSKDLTSRLRTTLIQNGSVSLIPYSDLQRGVIALKDSKNGETRQVLLNRTVRETLSVLPRNNREAYVFCKKDGNPYNFRSPFLRARKKAGVKDFKFHDLRHTAASYLVMKGVDSNTVREILGHKTHEMTLRYSHLSPEHKVRAVSVLDEDMDTIRSPKGDVVETPKKVLSCKSFMNNEISSTWRGGRVVECGGLENR